jgi:3-methylcrotonyl-CoA carboxylase alpha subunit
VTLQIGLEGRDVHEVALTRSGARATVWIDGIACPATSAAEGGATVVEIEGRRETVYCVTDRDTVFVHAFGRSWTLVVTDPVESSLRKDQGSDAAIAPMPGVLMALAVEPGDAVTAGQVIAVIESMKMQTQIAAPRDGVVDRVLVSVGGNFDGGAPLVTLVPEAGSSEATEG